MVTVGALISLKLAATDMARAMVMVVGLEVPEAWPPQLHKLKAVPGCGCQCDLLIRKVTLLVR